LFTKDFSDGKDIDVTVEANKQTVDELQRKLNEALHSIPFTLKCYTIKGKIDQLNYTTIQMNDPLLTDRLSVHD